MERTTQDTARRRKANPPRPRSGGAEVPVAVPWSRADILLSLSLLGLTGCGIAPRNFRALNHPAAVVRARSVGYGDRLPERQVIPALIERLNDPDPVVRMSAHEELRRVTGQDFGYVPWTSAEERARSVARWRAWWASHQGELARPRRKP